MDTEKDKITVYYDVLALPVSAIGRTMKNYRARMQSKFAGLHITGQDKQLRNLGIDPKKALSELHVKDENGRVVSELDAYILLMDKVPLLKPIAWFIGLPLIRSLLAKIYHWQVNRRLKARGLE